MLRYKIFFYISIILASCSFLTLQANTSTDGEVEGTYRISNHQNTDSWTLDVLVLHLRHVLENKRLFKECYSELES